MRVARSAVEGDSVAATAGRWQARLRRNAADRAAAFGLATLARYQYHFEEAERRYRTLTTPSGTTPDAWAVSAWVGLGRCASAQGESARADSLFNIALAKARRVEDSWTEAEALLSLSGSRSSGPGGIPAGIAALDTVELRLPPEASDLRAEYHCRLGLLRGIIGASDALASIRTGVAMAHELGERRLEGQCLEVEGLVHSIRGEYDPVLGLLDSAGALYRTTHDHASLARLESRRSDELQAQGRLAEATTALRNLLREAEISRNRGRVANAHGGLGALALLIGDLPRAGREFDRAAALYDSLGQVAGAAIARRNQAEVFARAGDTAAARQGFEGVLRTAERMGDVEDQFNAHRALAALARRARNWTAAEQQLAEAAAVAARHHLPDLRRLLAYDAGRLALARGRLDAAERNFTTALERVPADQYLQRHELRLLLAEVHARRGDLVRAMREFSTANSTLERWRATLTDEDLRIHAFAATGFERSGERSAVASILSAVAAGGRAEAAFGLAERRRARELADRIAQAGALHGTGSDGHLAERISVQAGPATAEDVAAALPDDSTALLEYVAGRSGVPSTLFVLTRGGVRAHRLPPIDSLADATARFAALLESGGEPGELARALGRALLEPALADLPPGIVRLIIVPAGALHHLPFDALLLPDGRPLVTRYAVSLAPSAAVLLALWQRTEPAATPVEPSTLLAFGDPAFAGERPAGTGRGPEVRAAFGMHEGLPRLAGSGREVQDISRFSPAATVRLRADASETFLKQADLDRFGVIHFATHALVDDVHRDRTALALAPGGGEDGFVTPDELAALELRADLVVLSACRSAGGVVVDGEGVQGLTAPFLEAGARAVVATGWRIADQATVKLMASFYRELAAGRTVSDALRAVKLAAIDRGAPASEWAAFTVVGDPFVQVPLAAPAPWRDWWPAAAGLAGLLLVAYAVRRRRGAA